MAYSAAFLIYDGLDLFDLAILSTVLSRARRPAAPETTLFELVTVAGTKAPVTTQSGIVLLPDHIYPDAQIYDLILLPGGPGYRKAMGLSRLMNWVRRVSRPAKVVAAVGSGIFLLAAAGLLNGGQAAAVPGLAEKFPTVKPVMDETIVSSGKVLTTAEPRHSYELGLAIIDTFFGSTVADHTALSSLMTS